MIIFNIEGPKGCGKSTVTERIANETGAKIVKFDSDNVMSLKDFEYYNEEQPVIFERGLLSYLIYDFLWDNDISAKSSDDFSLRFFNIKQPMQKRHFDYAMKMINGPYFILYTSDPAILTDRILSRQEETGKGANTLEWDTLLQSNVWFKAMADVLSFMYPDKVVGIDIKNYPTKDALYNKIKSHM